MRRKQDRPTFSASTELLTFVAVLAVCLSLTVYLGVSAPAEKRMTDYLAQGVFSALFALPMGIAWRSLWRAVGGRR